MQVITILFIPIYVLDFDLASKKKRYSKYIIYRLSFKNIFFKKIMCISKYIIVNHLT